MPNTRATQNENPPPSSESSSSSSSGSEIEDIPGYLNAANTNFDLANVFHEVGSLLQQEFPSILQAVNNEGGSALGNIMLKIDTYIT